MFCARVAALFFIATVLLLGGYGCLAGRVCAKRPYRSLVLEGGGIKGLAYAGAVRALEEFGELQHINGFAGSSAGSITAALLAAGYTGQEFEKVVISQDYRKLRDRGPWPWDDIRRLRSQWGLFKGDELQSTVEEALRKKTGISGVTFSQLYELTGKELKVTGTCVSTGELEIFDRQTQPDMRVSLAVRISSSIPFVFAAVKYNGKLYVDGGALRNLHLGAFSTDHKQLGGFARGLFGFWRSQGSTLALSLRNERLWGLSRGLGQEVEPTSFVAYAARLLDILLWGPGSSNSLREAVERSADSSTLDLVKVDTGNVHAVDFTLGDEQKQELVRAGYDAVAARLRECSSAGRAKCAVSRAAALSRAFLLGGGGRGHDDDVPAAQQQQH